MVGRVYLRSAAAASVALAFVSMMPAAEAASAAEIDQKVDLALDTLMSEVPAAREFADDAVAVLVFPDIVKGGFGIGGQYGEGALRRDGATVGYYNIAAASFGLQIGAQSFGQAMFFMTEDALAYLDRSEGFEVGADANVVLANEGGQIGATSSTVQDPIVAFVFGQQGLMAGVTIEGSKITKIDK